MTNLKIQQIATKVTKPQNIIKTENKWTPKKANEF